jgi:hypothetical protein
LFCNVLKILRSNCINHFLKFQYVFWTISISVRSC